MIRGRFSAYFYAKADQLGWRRWEERLELDTGTICAIQSPLDSRTLAPRLRRWRTRGYVTSQPPSLTLRNIWKRTWDDLVSEFRAMLWIQFRHSRLFMILSRLDSKVESVLNMKTYGLCLFMMLQYAGSSGGPVRSRLRFIITPIGTSPFVEDFFKITLQNKISSSVNANLFLVKAERWMMKEGERGLSAGWCQKMGRIFYWSGKYDVAQEK